MGIIFENEELFKGLSKEGFNLFLGAGFSVLAKNSFDESLPLGFELHEILIKNFDLAGYEKLSLPKVCQKLKRNRKGDLIHFLKERYRVSSMDELYDVIPKLPVKNIITTNIDNLVETIYTNSNNTFSDAKITGTIEKPNMTNLFKLHGSITYPFDNEMLFSHEEMNIMFLKEPSLWHAVAHKLRSYPTIFWGTNLEDGNITQLLSDEAAGNYPSKPKWILIRPQKENDIYAEEYKEHGFNIIRGTTKDLLNYLSGLTLRGVDSIDTSKENKFKRIFPANFVTEDLINKSRVRPIEEFFQGAHPVFTDIASHNLVRLSHFEDLVNIIYKYGNAVISGIPGCGKTTLLMQTALSDSIKGYKFYFNDILPDEAEKLLRLVDNDDVVYVFIDNIFDNLDSYRKLLDAKKVNVIGAERELNYENIKHLVKIPLRQIMDISELTQYDIQNICEKMNKPFYDIEKLKNNNEKVSLFEIVYSLWRNVAFESRIKGLINDIKRYDEQNPNTDLLEFFTLMTYISYTGIPASMDMLWLYYSYNENFNYEDIYAKRNKLSSLVREIPEEEHGIYEYSQDYFMLRSKVFSEVAISFLPASTFKKVLNNFLTRVNRSVIYRYDIFRKKAYDADITIKAFQQISDGISFYENYIKNDNSAYIKHQYALYLWRKGVNKKAWEQIDKAYTDSSGKKYSINNTHAMILFENNILVQPNDENELEKLKEVLGKTFKTLEICLEKDNRKSFHATKYAEHAIKYYEKFGMDKNAQIYLDKAKNYIDDELRKEQFMYRKVKYIFIELKKQIQAINKSLQKI